MKRTRWIALTLTLSLLSLYVGPSYAKRPIAAAGMGGNGRSGPAKATTSGDAVVGRVIFDGQPPKPTHISMSSDPSCSAAHPGILTNDDFVVGAC